MAWVFTDLSFETLVCERLKQCALDIGITTAFAFPPEHKLVHEELPCAYHFFGGTFTAPVQGANLVIVPRIYTQRILIGHIADGAADIAQDSELYRKATLWVTRAHIYYTLNPRLSTSTLPALKYCYGIMPGTGVAPIAQDGGLVSVPGPNGEQFAAVDIILNIVMVASRHEIT